MRIAALERQVGDDQDVGARPPAPGDDRLARSRGQRADAGDAAACPAAGAPRRRPRPRRVPPATTSARGHAADADGPRRRASRPRRPRRACRRPGWPPTRRAGPAATSAAPAPTSTRSPGTAPSARRRDTEQPPVGRRGDPGRAGAGREPGRGVRRQRGSGARTRAVASSSAQHDAVRPQRPHVASRGGDGERAGAPRAVGLRRGRRVDPDDGAGRADGPDRVRRDGEPVPRRVAHRPARARGSSSRGADRARRRVEPADRRGDRADELRVVDRLAVADPHRRRPRAATSVGVPPVASVSTVPVAGSTARSVRASASTDPQPPVARAASAAGVRPGGDAAHEPPVAASTATSSPPVAAVARRRGHAPRRAWRPRPPRRRRRAPRRPAPRSARDAAARGAGAATPGPGRQLERRLVAQHGLLQPAQVRARLEPELVDQRAPRVGVGLERLRLATAAVQREHQLRAQPLAQRVARDERAQLRRPAAAWRPSARSASTRSSSASSRSSSSASTAATANCSWARSASARPRHWPSAARSALGGLRRRRPAASWSRPSVAQRLEARDVGAARAAGARGSPARRSRTTACGLEQPAQPRDVLLERGARRPRAGRRATARRSACPRARPRPRAAAGSPARCAGARRPDGAGGRRRGPRAGRAGGSRARAPRRDATGFRRRCQRLESALRCAPAAPSHPTAGGSAPMPRHLPRTASSCGPSSSRASRRRTRTPSPARPWRCAARCARSGSTARAPAPSAVPSTSATGPAPGPGCTTPGRITMTLEDRIASFLAGPKEVFFGGGLDAYACRASPSSSRARGDQRVEPVPELAPGHRIVRCGAR